jgi:hypothetical protein
MKTKTVIITGILFITVNNLWSRGFESFSIGGGFGYSSYQTITGEGFLQGGLSLWARPFDVKAGISYLPCTSAFKGKDDWQTGSIGIFGEGIIYPFHRYLFAGIRWDAITFNRIVDKSQEAGSASGFNTFFTGTNFYGVTIAISFGLCTNMNLIKIIQKKDLILSKRFMNGNQNILRHLQFSNCIYYSLLWIII